VIGAAIMVAKIATGEVEDNTMAAGIGDTLWTMEDIAERIEANRPKAALGKRGPRGPYKKRPAA
jgi:hypothetical protein